MVNMKESLLAVVLVALILNSVHVEVKGQKISDAGNKASELGATVLLDIHGENKTQYLRQNFEQGNYKYGYDIEPSGPNGQFHHENKDPDGVVYGCFGYIDPNEEDRITFYVSDAWGFRPVSQKEPTEIFFPADNPEGTVDMKGTIVEWNNLGFPAKCTHFAKKITTISQTKSTISASTPNSLRNRPNFPLSSKPFDNDRNLISFKRNNGNKPQDNKLLFNDGRAPHTSSSSVLTSRQPVDPNVVYPFGSKVQATPDAAKGAVRKPSGPSAVNRHVENPVRLPVEPKEKLSPHGRKNTGNSSGGKRGNRVNTPNSSSALYSNSGSFLPDQTGPGGPGVVGDNSPKYRQGPSRNSAIKPSSGTNGSNRVRQKDPFRPPIKVTGPKQVVVPNFPGKSDSIAVPENKKHSFRPHAQTPQTIIQATTAKSKLKNFADKRFSNSGPIFGGFSPDSEKLNPGKELGTTGFRGISAEENQQYPSPTPGRPLIGLSDSRLSNSGAIFGFNSEKGKNIPPVASISALHSGTGTRGGERSNNVRFSNSGQILPASGGDTVFPSSPRIPNSNERRIPSLAQPHHTSFKTSAPVSNKTFSPLSSVTGGTAKQFPATRKSPHSVFQGIKQGSSRKFQHVPRNDSSFKFKTHGNSENDSSFKFKTHGNSGRVPSTLNTFPDSSKPSKSSSFCTEQCNSCFTGTESPFDGIDLDNLPPGAILSQVPVILYPDCRDEAYIRPAMVPFCSSRSRHARYTEELGVPLTMRFRKPSNSESGASEDKPVGRNARNVQDSGDPVGKSVPRSKRKTK